jgi:replication factor A1
MVCFACRAAPANRMASSGSRRVYPLVSLNPYQGSWTIQVRVTNKGPMRTFKTARGEGNVFSVELMDEEVRCQAMSKLNKAF